ncbi:MAG: RusA family crossover junction endodeoxyribonuclease [Acinetobacter sp.]|nr:RusA family crossover junction endodeoxyribonuclease [Acinetobacter sp.]
MKVKNNRRAWDIWAKSNAGSFSDPFEVKKTNRVARERRALGSEIVYPCSLKTEVIDKDSVHRGSTGGIVITGDNFITVRLPYGVSANDIWRATIDENGKQRNSLSVSAKKFKKKVFETYAPIFKALQWKALNEECEVRLMVQPPLKTRNYSAKTYPRFDIDNYPKLLIDSLKGSELLFKDDNIFVSEKIEFAEPVQDGCVWLSCVFIEQTNWLEKKVNFDWLAGRTV